MLESKQRRATVRTGLRLLGKLQRLKERTLLREIEAITRPHGSLAGEGRARCVRRRATPLRLELVEVLGEGMRRISSRQRDRYRSYQERPAIGLVEIPAQRAEGLGVRRSEEHRCRRKRRMTTRSARC